MHKMYFKILLDSILLLFTINIVSYFIGFNKNQLTNSTYFSGRSAAIYYLAKNIIIESGIHPVKVKQEDINKHIENASMKYNVDKNLLTLLISQENEYSMTFIGGMGLTSILPKNFLKSSYSDPYIPEQNIMAAAETLSRLQKENSDIDNIILKFVLGNDIEKANKFAKSEYIKAKNIASIYDAFQIDKQLHNTDNHQ